MKRVRVYTDGACRGNPGPGGWGAILVSEQPKGRKEISGAEPATTNNRMELTAVIEALSCLTEACEVTVMTDSKYVADAFRQGWLEKWIDNGWRTANKKPVKNADLWRKLLAVISAHQVKWEWVRGHSGHPENECADELAVAAIRSLAAK